MKRYFAVVRALLVIALFLAIPSLTIGGSTASRSMTMDIFNQVVDFQTNVGCPNPPNVMGPTQTGIQGDFSTNNLDGAIGPNTAWGFAQWPTLPLLTPPLSSSGYVDGHDCSNLTGGCLSVQLSKNLSVLSNNNSINTLDSSTGKPRFFTVNFANGYGGNPNYFGTQIVKTPGELGISMSVAWPNMAVCSTTDCKEMQTGITRFWFNDPAGNPNLQYEIVWNHMRLLRVSQTQWYAIADSCDGSQVATLYRQANNQKNPSLSNQGQYLMPFFIQGITGAQ